jgi:hypothetical protein
MRRPRPLAPAILAAALLVAPLEAQESPPPPPASATSPAPASPAAPSGQQAQQQTPAQPSGPQPLPYSPDEFPQWLRDMRRGEIITIGAFPIVYLFTQLGYNFFRYGVHGWDSQYAPLGNPNQVPYSTGETVGVLLGAASLSILVATADYLIGRSRARKAERGAAGGKP